MSEMQREPQPENEVNKILHRVRTRALRDAPIYLQHISEVEQDVRALVARAEARGERRGQILAVKRMLSQAEKQRQPYFIPYAEVEQYLATLQREEADNE